MGRKKEDKLDFDECLYQFERTLKEVAERVLKALSKTPVKSDTQHSVHEIN